MSGWDDRNEFQYEVEAKSGVGNVLNQSSIYIFDSLMSADGTVNVYNSNVNGLYNGRISIIDTWTPPAQAVGTWHRFDSTYLTIGMTETAGKTIPQLWDNYLNVNMLNFATSASMASSHTHGFTVAGIIPAGVGDGQGSYQADGSHPYYQEVGGLNITLLSMSPGHLLEGAGIWVVDFDYVGTPVPTVMNAFVAGVHKNDPANTYRSTGYTAGSIGSQQATYAPTAAFFGWGGWQWGLEFSLATFNIGAIKMSAASDQGSIIEYDTNDYTFYSASTDAFYWRIAGVDVLSVNSYAITAPAIKLTVGAGAGKVLVSDADGIGSWVLGGGGLMNIVEDTTPQLGGALDMNNFHITNTTATSGNYWFQFSASPATNYFNIFEVDGGPNGAGIISVRYKQEDHKNVTIQHNGTDGWITSDAGRLWLNASSYVTTNKPLDLYGQYIITSSASGDGNYYLEFFGLNTSDTYNVIMAEGNISGTYGIGVLQARHRKSTTRIIQVYHNGTSGQLTTLYGNIYIVPAGGTLAVTGNLTVSGTIAGTNANWDAAYGWGNHASEGYLKNVVEDTTPQLGANLDCQGYSLVGIADGSYNNVCCVGSGATKIGAVTAWYGTGATKTYGIGFYHNGTKATISSSGAGAINIVPYSGVLEINGAAVSYGANDSGGTGYKVLRVPN